VPLTEGKAGELGYLEEGGVLVLEVDKGSPAEGAGIQPDDIIIALDGKPLESFVFFRRKLLGLTPGHKIHLVVFRGGQPLEIWSVLGKKTTDE